MRFGPGRFSTHQACWCMQFPSPEKALEFTTGQYRHARCLSSCERTRDKWAQTRMSRRWFCLSRSPRCGGQHLDLVSTVGGNVGSARWAGTCHTAIPFIGWAIANCFFTSRGNMDTLKRTRKNDSIDAAQNAPTHHTNEKKTQEKDSGQEEDIMTEEVGKQDDEEEEETEKGNNGNSEDETDDGNSSNADSDHDSDISFMNDTDEEIDTAEIEEED